MGHSTHESEKIKAVSPGHPCEICGGKDKCSRGSSGLIFCGRREGPQCGYVDLGKCDKDPMWNLYRQEGDPHLNDHQRTPRFDTNKVHKNGKGDGDNHASGDGEPKSTQWDEKAKHFAAKRSPADLTNLAAELKLPERALSCIPNIGRHQDDGGTCYTFPEVNGHGYTVGISRRYVGGRKMAMAKSKRGLIVPTDWKPKNTPLFIVEGASDVAAFNALGIPAIGRPSNMTGADDIATLLDQSGLDSCVVVVLGEYDPKPDGKWPGLDGCKKVSGELAKLLGDKFVIRWMMPPDGAKDIRRWAIDQNLDPTCADDWSDAGDRFLKTLEDPHTLQMPGDVKAAADEFTFDVIDSPTFATTDYKLHWMIRLMLVTMQPILLGGPRKSLKTSIIVDLVLSLGSGTPFLGVEDFRVYNRLRVAILSGESGEAVLQETARRICKAKGIDLASVDVFWGFSLPQLANDSHLSALADGIDEHKIKVLVIDPLYLSLLAGLEGKDIDAANLFQMGPLLMKIARVCLDHGCTPILIHHTRKNLAAPFEPLELEDLAFSGIQEFARQWLLVSRREKYEPGSGKHQLWLSVGGSAGQGGQWAIDVDEGQLEEDFSGRTWNVTLANAAEARKEAANDKHHAKCAEEETKLLEAIDKLSKGTFGAKVGFTKTRQISGLSGDKMTRVVQRLVDAGMVEECDIQVTVGSKAIRSTKGLRRVTKSSEDGEKDDDLYKSEPSGPSGQNP